MDPKLIGNLDPKLRETYERVMGTSLPSSPPPPAAAPANDTSKSPPPSQPQIPTPAASVTPPAQEFASQLVTPVLPTPPAATAQTSALNTFQPLPSPASVNQETQSQSASPLLRVLYVVGLIIFFLLYTIFWIKVFKLNFPF